jgi:hypothetical protein
MDNPSKQFIIYQEGDRQMIERLSYPRFKGVITFNSSTSDIEDIELLDKSESPTELAQAMREAGEFIIENTKH